MARPLTKTGPDGARYTRPAELDAQIDAVIQLSLPELRARLLLTNRNDPGYLRHESLVHLVRQGRRSADDALLNTVLPILLGRCEAVLNAKVPDGQIPDAASVRDEILAEFSELFVVDGLGECPDALDFYECRFNLAFRALRIDAVRREARRLKHVASLPLTDLESGSDSFEDAFARVSDAFTILPTQEWDAFREPFLKAIDALPADERDAVVLVHVLGYKVESGDPDEDTAATRCKCTGRTIRNRLMRAAAKLSRFKEAM